MLKYGLPVIIMHGPPRYYSEARSVKPRATTSSAALECSIPCAVSCSISTSSSNRNFGFFTCHLSQIQICP